MNRSLCILAGLGLAGSLAAQSVTVNVTFENLSPAGGLYLTPVFTGFHDGGFDLFDSGGSASAGLEDIAEIGQTGTLATAFGLAQPNGLSATSAPGGPFAPGSSLTVQFTLDPTDHRYLAFATMVVPSNDTFLGNADPIELFDAGGNLMPLSLTLTGAQAWDAGTEVNDVADGPAFVVGQVGTDGTTEGGTIALLPTNGLDSFIGVSTAAGPTLTSALSGGDLFRLTVTAVPEPSMVALLVGLAALGAALRRRRV